MTNIYDTANSTAQASSVAMVAPLTSLCKTYFFGLPLAMTSETLRFAGHRLDEQARLFTKLSGCKTPSEVAEVQSDFFKEAVGDNRKQAGSFAHRAKEAVS
jgi:hypothetical protein